MTYINGEKRLFLLSFSNPANSHIYIPKKTSNITLIQDLDQFNCAQIRYINTSCCDSLLTHLCLRLMRNQWWFALDSTRALIVQNFQFCIVVVFSLTAYTFQSIQISRAFVDVHRSRRRWRRRSGHWPAW